jgi:hypothetical protein
VLGGIVSSLYSTSLLMQSVHMHDLRKKILYGGILIHRYIPGM